MDNYAERIARLEHKVMTLKAVVEDHENRIRVHERLRFMVFGVLCAIGWVVSQADIVKSIMQ